MEVFLPCRVPDDEGNKAARARGGENVEELRF